MVNGRFDYLFPLETSQLPLFNHLGTPAEHKHHVLLEAGHGHRRGAESCNKRWTG